MLISKTYKHAKAFQKNGTAFLNDQLKLTLHTKNNLIIPIRHGVRYLGVISYPNGKTLSDKTFKEILKKKSLKNQDSYTTYVGQYGSKRQYDLINCTNLTVFQGYKELNCSELRP